MKYFLPAFLLLLVLPAARLAAQTASSSSLFQPSLAAASSPTPANPKGKPGDANAPQGPTIIDSDQMDYDEKTRIAIFTGDDYGVLVKDPSFTVYCDKLTAHMRKAGAAPAAPGPGPKKPATPAPTPAAGGTAAAASSRSSGLESALAEGTPDRPVVVVQDKPAANGEEAQHNVGIALKADYNADTGDVKLTGWPRVSQGINTQIATAESTIMIMNKDGHTMKTIGPSHTVIQEQDQSKKSGTNSADSNTASPSPSPL